MHLQESGEMYLESILVLSKKNNYVRAIDICEYMGYSKPSVSRALGLLKDGGYVVSDKNGYLSLTETGRDVAEKIYDRHTQICDFLQRLGVSSEVATEDACKIEHVISDEALEAIKNHVKNMK
ncbi:MAG: metal-dependent transcriptional regulator [Ruminococcaceae bacterium]|nr:metal-dependent transcriptional regulator [Oscillospiraceae bacterium]